MVTSTRFRVQLGLVWVTVKHEGSRTEPNLSDPLTEPAPGLLQPLDLVLDEEHRHSEGEDGQQLELGRHRGP